MKSSGGWLGVAVESVQGGRRREVLELFRASRDPLTARDVAAELGLHINTVRFHLDALVREGTLRREEGRADGRGRPRTQYAMMPGMDRGGPRNYKLLAEMLLSHLAADDKPVDAAISAGASWGSYLIAPPAPGQRLAVSDGLTRLTELLSDIGFDPGLSAGTGDGTRIELRHCPFLELADTHRELVCALHLGLMRGALEKLHIPLRADSLVPFADPHTCVAHLSATDAGRGTR